MNELPPTTNSDETAQARFLRLFLSSERELYRYVAALVPHRADAEEIVQQTAVELWSRFDQYDPQLPFTPWACRFALNVVKQWLARRKRWQTLLNGTLAETLVERRAELRSRFESRLTHLEGCLEKLPTEQREVLHAYYVRREPTEVIAASIQKTMDAIYKSLQRGRMLLRRCIEQAALAGNESQ